MIRVQLVGSGRVARHYAKLKRGGYLDFVEFVACSDINFEKAKSLSLELNCKCYSDYLEMVANNSSDLVIVCNESGRHYDVAKQLLLSGKNILIEKPVTLRLEQAQELHSIAVKNKLYAQVVYQNRYNPALVACEDAVSRGLVGDLISLHVSLVWCRYQDYYNDGWHGTWKMDGGVVSQQAIHHIDALQWIAGVPRLVYSRMRNAQNHLEAEDTMSGLIEFESGALATISVTTAARPEDIEASISVLGTSGYIKVGGIALNEIAEWKLIDSKEDLLSAKKKYSTDVDSGYGIGHVELLRRLSRSLPLSIKVDNDLTIVEAEKSLKLIHALYRSVETGNPVEYDCFQQSARLGLG